MIIGSQDYNISKECSNQQLYCCSLFDEYSLDFCSFKSKVRTEKVPVKPQRVELLKRFNSRGAGQVGVHQTVVLMRRDSGSLQTIVALSCSHCVPTSILLNS